MLAMPTRHNKWESLCAHPVALVAHPCPRRDYAALAVIVRAAAFIAFAMTPFACLFDNI